MMAAISASEMLKLKGRQKSSVAILEKNASLARKLGLTGKGRCNITNASSVEDFLKHFGNGADFLRDAFRRFFVAELMDFLRSKGCQLKVERQGRVFPQSDTSKTVIDVFINAIGQLGVSVLLNSPVKKLLVENNAVSGVILSDGSKIFSQRCILACGGASFPHTGSTGDGFRIAQEAGHNVKDLSAGLVPLESEDPFIRELKGLTLKNVTVNFICGSKEITSSVGELLFTHFGISGPLVLNLSFKIAPLLRGERSVVAKIDLKPGLSFEKLNEKVKNEIRKAAAKKLSTYLSGLLPARFVDVFLKKCDIDENIRCGHINASQRHMIVQLIKGFPVGIKRTRPLSEAMVTCGGVSLKEINPRTLESKKIKGLYFCGEVMDIAADSGGYNLQAAFSSGFLAGESAALSLINL